MSAHYRVTFPDGHRATVEATSADEAKKLALEYLKEHRFETEHLSAEMANITVKEV